jgi:hypothetical protein
MPPIFKFWEPSPSAGIRRVVELKREYGVDEGLSDEQLAYGLLEECIYGQQDSGWLSYYDYLINEENDCISMEKMSGQVELAKHCGLVWVYDLCAVLTSKPIFISFDENETLHNETRKAIE